MIVYRVEHHVWGDGPYNGGHAIDAMAELHSDDPEHPAVWSDLGYPWDDIEALDTEPTNFVCGFGSREALDAWFEGWEHHLHAHGFVVREFEVDPPYVLTGDLQLAFIKSNARLIESRPIREEVMA